MPEHVIPILPVNPVSIPWPFCKANPGKECATISVGFSAIHVQRIKAAAKIDAQNIAKR